MRLFRLLALGDVARDAEQADDLALRIVHRSLGGQERARHAGGGHKLLERLGDARRHDKAVAFHHLPRVVRQEQGRVVLAQHFLTGFAHEPARRGVEHQITALGVLHIDCVRRGIDDELQQVLIVPEPRLHLLARGDVAADGLNFGEPAGGIEEGAVVKLACCA